jgi:DHA1 family bicyclomycin/chloramphenicol resistance-like MFS transporter
MPAMQAIIVSLVPEKDRARSASLTTTVFAVVPIVAPLVGTTVAGTIGFGPVLMMDLLSFLLASLLLFPVPSVPGGSTLRSPVRSTWLAFRNDASTLLRYALAIEAIYFLLWGADEALALLILRGHFGPAVAGVYSAALGVGFVLASVMIPARFKRRPSTMIAVGAASGPVGAVAFVALVQFGPAAAFLPGVLLGVGNMALNIGATTVFQQEADTKVAGRLFAIQRAILNSMLTISYLVLPAVSVAGLGNGATFILFSVLMFVAVLVMTWFTNRRTPLMKEMHAHE